MMETNGNAGVRVERSGALLLVTIDRPAVRNAIDSAAAWAIAAAMDQLEDDPDLFLGIITGAGGIFSAGADISPGAQAARRPLPSRGNFGLCHKPPAKPLIAAIEGFALGGGFEIALACDMIVAARDARLGLPEVRHGLVALGGGAFRLPRRLPYHLAAEIVLSGNPRDAAFYFEHGLINRLTAPGEALIEARRLAETLLLNGPLALAASVLIMRSAHEWSDIDAWKEQERIAGPLRNSEDRAEGLKAFAEKRRPIWKGR